MKIAYSIHELVLKGERVSPKSVVEIDNKTFEELEALGAVREATDEEAVISGLGAKSVPAAPKQTAAEKKAAAAAAKKADEDAAAAAAGTRATDPDVVPDPNAEADLLGDN